MSCDGNWRNFNLQGMNLRVIGLSNSAQIPISIQSSLGKSEGGFPMTPQPRDWRLVAEQIRDEKDSNKMMELVIELDCLLEREEKTRKHPHSLCV